MDDIVGQVLSYNVRCVWIRRPSCYSCIRVNTVKSSTDAVAEKLSAILKEKDGEFGGDENPSEAVGNGNSNIIEGVADVLKGSFGGGLVSKCQFPGLDYVLFVRGSGPHTIDYGYADGKPPKEVIVSRKCAEAVLRGAQVVFFSYESGLCSDFLFLKSHLLVGICSWSDGLQFPR